MEEKTDVDIIDEVLNGNVNAFEVIVKRYEKMVYNLCITKTKNHETALDLSQECFIKAYRMLTKYKHEYAFSTWIYSICKNIIIDWFRKNKYVMSMDNGYGYEADDTQTGEVQYNDPLDIVIKNEETEILREIIMGLPHILSEAVILRDLCDYTYEDIALMLNENINTVKSRLHRARIKLKEELLKKRELL